MTGERVDEAAFHRQAKEARRDAKAAPIRKRRDTLTPTDPGTPILEARIRRRWAELCAEAQRAGKVVGHCHEGRGMTRGHGTDFCQCECDGCDRALTLLVKAERDVRGPSGTPTQQVRTMLEPVTTQPRPPSR